MDNPFFIPPNFDDETVVKLRDFIYEVLNAFETHYYYQIARHDHNARLQRLHDSSPNIFIDEPPF